jgi:parallel beta-helix repeat protein
VPSGALAHRVRLHHPRHEASHVRRHHRRTRPKVDQPGANTHAALLATAQITGTTYYVSPSGSDSNSGTSPLSPWRTVTQVNRASPNFKPGDGVLFQGGATFSDTTLMPGWGDPIYGVAGAPIVFGSYGTGRATITDGVWFPDGDYMTFDNLNFGPQAGFQGGNESGTANNITVQRCRIALAPGNSAVGLTAYGNNWSINHDVVSNTGDSGMLLIGDADWIYQNTIKNTGLDPGISYGKHGIYLKVSNATVTDNTITNFSQDGISVRYRDSQLYGNVISGGAIGIAWFQYDTIAGTSDWRRNRIQTSVAGIYVSPSDRAGKTTESFVITDNTLAPQQQPSSWAAMNLKPTTGSYTLSGNTIG